MGIICSGPAGDVEPEGEEVRCDRLPGEQILVSSPRTLGDKTVAAERRSKIKQVVLDVTGAALLHKRVEGVEGLRIVVPQPGRENEETAQGAAMLMGGDII